MYVAPGGLLIYYFAPGGYLNLEGVDKEIVESDQGQSILHLEPIDEGPHKVRRLLQVLNVHRLLAAANLHVPCLQIESNLKKHKWYYE